MCGCNRGTASKRTGAYNFAGATSPIYSSYGQALGRAPQNAKAALAPPELYREYRNVLGTFLVRSANPSALFNERAYPGDYPLQEQPEVRRRAPWETWRGVP